MKIFKGVGDFFGLDIGTTAVRVVQLSPAGQGMWHLQHYGYVPVDEKTTAGSSEESKTHLGEAIMTAIGQSGIKATDVAMGIPSSKTTLTVVDVPVMGTVELSNTIKYQADQYIPMNINDAKFDWALLGQSLHDSKQQEVLLASTEKAYSESRLDLVESLGFNVIAMEPDPLAISRALTPVSGVSRGAYMIIEVGETYTDLVVAYDGNPRLVRTIPTGFRTLVRSVVQNLNVDNNQARQFMLKFGMAPDKLEGQVYHSVESTVDAFVTELTKSIKFFQTRYPSTPVGVILLSGFAAIIPAFGSYIASKTGVQANLGNPWQGVHVSRSDQQQLSSVASEFSTAIGLAERGSK